MIELTEDSITIDENSYLHIKEEDEEILGEPIQLVSIEGEKERKFTVHDEAIDFLKGIQEPLGVIAVGGKYRTGKSYLLNKIILNNNQNGFKVGPTINAGTKGLMVWSKPLQVTQGDKTFKVIVIDSEGMGCVDSEKTNDQESSMIFLLTMLISSYFIYNSMGLIDKRAIENLSVISQIGKQLLAKNSQAENQQNVSCFPSFLWVVRDFSLQLVDDNGHCLSPKDYLERALKEDFSLSEVSGKSSTNQVRRTLRSLFVDRDCFTLVRPVEEEAELQKLEHLNYNELRREFKQGVNRLQTKILGALKVKTLNDVPVTGELLANILCRYVDCINRDEVPTVDSAWNYLCQSEGEKHINKVLNKYNQGINNVLLESLNYYSYS